MPPAVLISLPQGLSLSGITSWAVRLADGLAPPSDDQSSHHVEIVAAKTAGESANPSPAVHVTRIEPADFGSEAGVEAHRDAIRRLCAPAPGPIVALPSLSEECYALFARLASEINAPLRILAWTHNDIEHDYRLAEHFDPFITAFASVSTHIASELRARLPHRASDIFHIPYGVDLGDDPPPTRRPGSHRPLRILYAGRFDHFQKRVMALHVMSRVLREDGIDHQLTLLGGGPAELTLRDAFRDHDRVEFRPLADPLMTRRVMREHDLFVLPSRFEGLSQAMLEAMAEGCVPVVTRVASGATDAVEPGVNGELALPDGDDHEVGCAMAYAVQRAINAGLDRLAHAARDTIRRRFSLASHLDLARHTIAAAARAHPRHAAAQPPARGRLPFTVPDDAPLRAQRAFAPLGGRRIALWGAGRHTAAIAPEFDRTPARIVALIDDDQGRLNERVAGIPVVEPRALRRMGVTDVVISSALHETALWERRAERERLGLRVHRMYAPRRSPIARHTAAPAA